MRVELINTGSELLLGQVVNTHLSYLAEALWPAGFAIERQVTVPDGSAIRDALADAFTRSEVIIVTGGLGPTTDDITRDVAAELLGLTLQTDPDIARGIETRLATRGIKLTSRILRQAERPVETEVLVNTCGTAPGLYFPPLPAKETGRNSPHLFLLPGPPRELKPMVENELLPRLKKLLPEGPKQLMQTWRVVGVPESTVEEEVGEALIAMGIEPGYCARPNEVDVRIIGSANQQEAAARLLNEKFGNAVLPKDTRSLEQWIVEELVRRNLKIATAEAATGGLLASRITDVPGSSLTFCSGTIGSTARGEEKDPPQKLAEPSESAGLEKLENLARTLATRALECSAADYALSTAGWTEGGDATDGTPPGTVAIGLASKTEDVHVEKFRFSTDRLTLKQLAAQAALRMLRATLLKSQRPD
jgi:nicotinamide-nucleotide amidase